MRVRVVVTRETIYSEACSGVIQFRKHALCSSPTPCHTETPQCVKSRRHKVNHHLCLQASVPWSIH